MQIIDLKMNTKRYIVCQQSMPFIFFIMLELIISFGVCVIHPHARAPAAGHHPSLYAEKSPRYATHSAHPGVNGHSLSRFFILCGAAKCSTSHNIIMLIQKKKKDPEIFSLLSLGAYNDPLV